MQSEVTEINKQKFLAELGKLLTFMYDEDRQTALEMYGRMFDAARDEQTLLQFLVSPTRQAVVIARAYNARERKLQVDTRSRESEYYEEDGTPDFVLAIEELEKQALGQDIVSPEVSADQFTLFADGIHPTQNAAESADAAKPAEVEAPADKEPEAVAYPVEVKAEAEEAPEAVEAEVTEESEADAVEAFLSEFSIADEPLAADTADEQAGEPERTETAPAVAPAALDKPQATKPRAPIEAEAVDLTEKKPIIPLLILYVIAAIPVVALCVLLLLIPTLFFLVMSVGAVTVGCMALSSAFGAFTIFADVMVVLGTALLVLALGLLFLWLFVWFIGGAIAGFVNGIIKLGGKWCYKEVPAA